MTGFCVLLPPSRSSLSLVLFTDVGTFFFGTSIEFERVVLVVSGASQVTIGPGFLRGALTVPKEMLRAELSHAF